CTHGRKLPETSAYSNENWQFQHAENAGDALQWMWFGGFSGATRYSAHGAVFAEAAHSAGCRSHHRIGLGLHLA
ncbi:hypothetical protein, partial [Xanthomonas nasturtii]|uniref:hypothetical protein n=1 Tax=Xanthomonas nasturtii TaxID=1843581 RepID=UPI001C6E115E